MLKCGKAEKLKSDGVGEGAEEVAGGLDLAAVEGGALEATTQDASEVVGVVRRLPCLRQVAWCAGGG
jgi:hypothetical protein